MLLAVLSGFLLAAAAPWLQKRLRAWTGWVLALLPAVLTAYFVSRIGPVSAGEVFRSGYSWVPSLGTELSFYLDGLSLLFALIICGTGTLVVIYSGGYLSAHPQLGRFYAFLLLFMASMLGLVLADNVITLFVFWELTSISSYLLIGFDHERAEARAAALKALLVTGLGGVALLASVLLLGLAGGSLELSVLLTRSEALRSHSLYLPALWLLLVGAFSKSAQFPFHFWLPAAMEAPTPVSAYLHSATMVKGGVYLLARVSPLFSGEDLWFFALTVVGGATMLVGGYRALQAIDMKRVLAHSTVSALGTLVFLLGIGTEAAACAAAVYLLAHALYKGALFLVAGALDHETGVRDLPRLGGLGRAMPLTAAAGFLAALSMAGLPLFVGYLGKELHYEAAWEAPGSSWVLTGVSVVTGILLFAVAGRVGLRPFVGALASTPKPPHEAPFSLWSGPLLLAAGGFLFGIAPALVESSLLPMASAIRGELVELHLALWHGGGPLLALTTVTFAAGGGLFFLRVYRYPTKGEPTRPWSPEAWYDRTLAGLNSLATGQTRILQSGSLRYYLLLILGTATGLGGYTLLTYTEVRGWLRSSDVRFYELGVAVLIVAAAVAAVRSRSRLGAVAALGVVGYGVALIYVMFGAPDLALTQILVETLTVILFVLVFYHLPRFATLSTPRARLRDAGVALLAGGLVTMLVLAVRAAPAASQLSPYFAEHALKQAHGRNIVNVILVDFRALDTLGEITVLAVAGVGVYAVLKLRLAKKEEG